MRLSPEGSWDLPQTEDLIDESTLDAMNLFFFNLFFKLIFGCIGSLLLHVGFL